MKTATANPKEVYLAGYAAFDQGDFTQAVLLASQCLAAAPPDSYWHYGALGLRCWASNYLGDNATVEQDANSLLSDDAGSDKPWFDGLALLNLGLVRQRTGHIAEAKTRFAQASQRYAAYEIGSGQPHTWALINRFFGALTHWASCGESDILRRLAQELAGQPTCDEELNRLADAVGLYLRRAAGEDVAAAAAAAAHQGVSRAFLGYILLEEADEI